MPGRSISKVEREAYLVECAGSMLKDYYKEYYNKDVIWDYSVNRHEIVQGDFTHIDHETGEFDATTKHLCRENPEHKVKMHILPHFTVEVPSHCTVDRWRDEWGYMQEYAYYDEWDTIAVYACPDCGKIIYVVI